MIVGENQNLSTFVQKSVFNFDFWPKLTFLTSNFDSKLSKEIEILVGW